MSAEQSITDAERGFLAVVCADPLDDTARLVYADWLEEHGGRPERAEFIRLQLAIANWGICPGAPHGPPGSPPTPKCECRLRKESRAREYWLLRTHGHSWVPSIGTLVAQHDGGTSEGVNYEVLTDSTRAGLTCDFARGFIATVTCSAADWLTHADALRWRPEQDRPCPETAQPLTTVVLTTWPECFHGGDTDSDLDDRQEYWLLTADGTMPDDELELGVWFPRGTEPETPEMIRTLLKHRWSRLEIKLPEL